MRLIDADAFTEFLKDAIKQQKYEDTKIERLLTVADVIEAVISELDGTSLAGFKNAPTIEPERKTGRWIRHPEQTNIYGGNCVECPECGEKYMVSYIEDEKFCRNCGAKMEEESCNEDSCPIRYKEDTND